MKNVSILAATVLVTGCTSITDVSSDKRYVRFVDTEIVLNKPVLVCSDEALVTKKGTRIQNKLLYNVNSIAKCPFGETNGLLTPGNKLHVERVERHRIFGLKTVTHIYFLGNTRLPNGKKVEFFYRYGAEGFYDHQPW